MGTDSAVAVDSLLKGLDRPEAGMWGTLVGIVVVVAGATTVFAELQDAMDRIWRAPPHPETGGFLRFLKVRLLSTTMVLGIGFCAYGFRLWRRYSDELARETFRFSLVHLSVLFAALLVDHYVL